MSKKFLIYVPERNILALKMHGQSIKFSLFEIFIFPEFYHNIINGDTDQWKYLQFDIRSCFLQAGWEFMKNIQLLFYIYLEKYLFLVLVDNCISTLVMYTDFLLVGCVVFFGFDLFCFAVVVFLFKDSQFVFFNIRVKGLRLIKHENMQGFFWVLGIFFFYFLRVVRL